MGALANKTHTIASDVTDGSTFTTTYPTGFTQATLRGTTDGQLVFNGNVYGQDASGGVTFTFGASTITVKNSTGLTLTAGSVVTLSFGRTARGGSYNVTIGSDHDQAQAGDGSGSTIQTLTASGVVAGSTTILDLNHISVVIAATIDMSKHQGLFIIRDISASGTAAHTVTASNGTWDGTNTVATLNAPGEQLTVFIDSAGRGTIIQNTGAVGLS